MQNQHIESASPDGPARVDLFIGPDRRSAALARILRRRGIEFTTHDITEDSEAAAAIRGESGDAVPVVKVGALSSVDPAPDAIEVLVRRFAPASIRRRSLAATLRPWR